MVSRSGMPLAAAWLLTGAVVGVVGWLLFALSERSADRAAGAVLAAASALAVVLGLALLGRVAGARRWSLVLSGCFVVVGVAAAVVLLTLDAVFVSDVLLVGVPPVVGGLVTGLLARSGRQA